MYSFSCSVGGGDGVRSLIFSAVGVGARSSTSSGGGVGARFLTLSAGGVGARSRFFSAGGVGVRLVLFGDYWSLGTNGNSSVGSGGNEPADSSSSRSSGVSWLLL